MLAADNKLLIVKLGGLEPLIRQMLSPNVEVQCNAVGCVTNLATHGDSIYAMDLNACWLHIQTTTSPRSPSPVLWYPLLAWHVRRTCAYREMRLARYWTWHTQVGLCGYLAVWSWPTPVTSDENRQQLVNAGAIPVLVNLLNSPDTDVQYYCTTALSNIAVDGRSHLSSCKLVTIMAS